MSSPQQTDDLLPSEVARFDEVCRFGLDKLEPNAMTVALAFADDPIWMWIYDRSSTLELDEALPLARALVADTSPVDETHGFRHHDALALWRAPLDQNTEATEAIKAEQSAVHFGAFAALVGERMALVGEFSAAIKAARPEEPHWYLSILATNPNRQNQGLGSRTIAPMMERSDRTGVPIYLESSNPRNHAFYLRHGFREQGNVSGAGSPSMMTFYRPPS